MLESIQKIFATGLVGLYVVIVPYTDEAKRIEVDFSETFPDIWVTYECEEIKSVNNYEYEVLDYKTMRVNYGFFRIHRTLKKFECE